MHLARCGATVIEHEDPRGDPFRVKAVANRITAQRRDKDVRRVEVFAAMQCQRRIGPRTR